MLHAWLVASPLHWPRIKNRRVGDIVALIDAALTQARRVGSNPAITPAPVTAAAAPPSGRSRFEAPFVWPAHEILSRYATSTTIQLFLRPLENNYPVIPTSPLCGLRFQVVHRQTSFRVRGGSRSEVSAMGDRRKCQTYAASPAEPGGLPVMLEACLKMRFFLQVC